MSIEDEIARRLELQLARIRAEMTRAFDLIWSGPEMPTLVVLFMEGEVQFQISRNGVLILAEKPPTGDAVPDDLSGLDDVG